MFGRFPAGFESVVTRVAAGPALQPATPAVANLDAAEVAQADHLAVAVAGQPIWEADGRPGTAASILAAWQREGVGCLRRLDGGFAVAIADRGAASVHLCIDRMGIGVLAYAATPEALCFATSTAAVADALPGGRRLRPQALYDYMFFHMVPGPDSVFAGVRKLPPATVLSWKQGRAEISPYWQPDFTRRSTTSVPGLAAELKAALRTATAHRYAGAGTGAFLSGGLDSSTVTGMLAAVAEGPAQTFSMGFGVAGFDELEYARISARHFGCQAHEYVVRPQDIVDAIPTVVGAFDEPFGNSSAVPTYCCARFARAAGMHTLLAGDGGDEIFGGNERYARQRVFEAFWLLPEVVRRPLAGAVRALIRAEHPLLPLRKLRSYIDQASIPLPERFESWNFVYREGAQLLFEPSFMAVVDAEAPMRLMCAEYARTRGADYLDRVLAYDWKFTLADNDLRKVGTMCAAAGVNVAYPMLANGVIDVSLRVPSPLKMRGLELRSFYKQAMKGFLADEVLAKSKHGFGLPFGIWLKEHAPLSDFVYQCLTDLKTRRIVRADFIDRLVAEHRDGHPGYYGYVIWDLAIVSAWLQKQPTSALTW